MFNQILVVCVGNICRSPIGERVLQRLLPDKTIASAGLLVERSHLTGKPADPMAIEVAAQQGINLENHQARQLTCAMCSQHDLILVMEKDHVRLLTNLSLEARGKTMLFGKWLNEMDISDPYRQSKEAFVHVCQLINESAECWAKKLK